MSKHARCIVFHVFSLWMWWYIYTYIYIYIYRYNTNNYILFKEGSQYLLVTQRQYLHVLTPSHQDHSSWCLNHGTHWHGFRQPHTKHRQPQGTNANIPPLWFTFWFPSRYCIKLITADDGHFRTRSVWVTSSVAQCVLEACIALKTPRNLKMPMTQNQCHPPMKSVISGFRRGTIPGVLNWQPSSCGVTNLDCPKPTWLA